MPCFWTVLGESTEQWKEWNNEDKERKVVGVQRNSGEMNDWLSEASPRFLHRPEIVL